MVGFDTAEKKGDFSMHSKALVTSGVAVIALLAFIFSSGSEPLQAQLLYGSLVGNVTDGTGAVIPGGESHHHERRDRCEQNRRSQRFGDVQLFHPRDGKLPNRGAIGWLQIPYRDRSPRRSE